MRHFAGYFVTSYLKKTVQFLLKFASDLSLLFDDLQYLHKQSFLTRSLFDCIYTVSQKKTSPFLYL